MESTRNWRDLLRWAINKHRKQTAKEVVEDIVTKYDADKYSKELLKIELSKYEKDAIVGDILEELDREGMWGKNTQHFPTFSMFELDGLI